MNKLKVADYGVVVDRPKDLILRKDETCEWCITFEKGRYPYIMKDDIFIIHADTAERAESGFKKMKEFKGCKVMKVEYIGTYQY